MFEPMELTNDAVIKVIGVGGGGGAVCANLTYASPGAYKSGKGGDAFAVFEFLEAQP